MFRAYYDEMLKNYKPGIAFFSAMILIVIGITVYMTGQTQDPRQRASEPTISPIACPTPPACAPGTVLVEELDNTNIGENHCPVYICK